MTARTGTAGAGRRLGALLVASALALPLTVGPAAAEEPGTAQVAGSGPTAGGTALDVPAVPESGFVAVESSQSRQTAIDTEGRLFSWGGEGTYGDGTGESVALEPRAVDMSGVLAGAEIVQVSSGNVFSLALDADGRVYAWGYNGEGQLGQGHLDPIHTPVEVPRELFGGKVVTKVAAATRSGVALTEDGTVYSWGSSNYGVLCDGGSAAETGTPRPTPAPIIPGALDGLTVTDVAAGWDTVVMIGSNGRVFTCGRNAEGSLGQGVLDSASHRSTPGAVTWPSGGAGLSAERISGGGSVNMMQLSDGSLWAWGHGSRGALGNGSTASAATPQRVTLTNLAGRAVADFEAVPAGGVLATTDGLLYTWGSGLDGGLGNGTTSGDRSTPAQVALSGEFAGASVVAVTGGGFGGTANGGSYALLTDDHRIATWGRSNVGQTGSGSTAAVTRPTATAWPERVFFDGVQATSLTGLDTGTWTATSPPHAAGLVDVTVARGAWQVVYPDAFLYGDPLSPEILAHPERVLVTQAGEAVTLTSAARGNTEPTATWEWAPRGTEDWQPVTDGVVTSGAQDGEVFRVGTSLAVESTADARQYRVVYANHLGTATTELGWVVVGVPRPVHLLVTPRAVLVEALPARG